jgi:ribulose-phosphate 3-epimerase
VQGARESEKRSVLPVREHFQTSEQRRNRKKRPFPDGHETNGQIVRSKAPSHGDIPPRASYSGFMGNDSVALEIAPSILSADFVRLAEEIRAVEEAGADVIHVDVMDGHFVPNITLGPPLVKAIRPVTGLPLDVHLMIEAPDRYLDAFAEAGASWLTVHVEACTHLHRTIEHIRKLGLKAGAVLNPATPPSSLEYVLEDVDIVLVMGVNPGFGGQRFIRSSVRKLEELREMRSRSGYSFRIEVDGGINRETIGDVVAAGADICVAGSAVFHSSNYRETINELRTLGLAGIAGR